MWGAHEGMAWWMLFGGVFWVLFIGTMVYLFASTFGRRTGDTQGRSETPLEVAKRRLASGEISHEEYERIRDALSR
ncbi:MAG: SHOCT domain-containing protein [Dehalococcoidia bacterium]|nr:SHOCT domain-containing protein [Dehalococcoidia bacterium]